MGEDRAYGYDVFNLFTERWPEAGDRLFVSGWDSFLAEGADERKYRLLQGYKRADDVLIQHALADVSERDNLIWPAVFGYSDRQSAARQRLALQAMTPGPNPSHQLVCERRERRSQRIEPLGFIEPMPMRKKPIS